MGFIISKLSPQELAVFIPVFSQILRTEFPEYTPKIISYFLEKIYTEANFSYWLASGTKTVFVAKPEKSNEIVGFAVIDEPYGGVSSCRWLGVKREYQKNGVGKSLIIAWTSLAKKQQCHKIELAARIKAREFYEKVGLQPEGKRILSYFAIDQYIFGSVLGEPDEDGMTQI